MSRIFIIKVIKKKKHYLYSLNILIKMITVHLHKIAAQTLN